ncbi:MAG: tetratricopeptide repeat protein [Gammaproteobacteria bacterium]|nr:tetratricopeptide repeat protein [Gammaproteobacteria bacterium]
MSAADTLRDALARCRSGRVAEAEQLCRSVLSAQPAHTEATKLLAVILAMTQRHHEARAALAQVIEADPADVGAHVNHGHVLAELGEPAAALQSYQRALLLDPGIAEAHLASAKALRRLNRREDALASGQLALRIRPDYAEALNDCGTTLHELKRFNEALGCYDRALEIQANLADCWYNRALTLQAIGEHEQALESFARGTRLQPQDASLWYQRGVTLHQLRRLPEAVESYQRALQIDAYFAAAYSACAATLTELQRFEEALAHSGRALQIDPQSAGAWNNRGVTLHTQLRFGEALSCFERALQLAPDFAEVEINRAATLNELQRCEEALACCARALQVRPGYAEAYYGRGALLAGNHRIREGVESLTAAIALDPEFAAAYEARAYALLMGGDFERGWVDHEWRCRNPRGLGARSRLRLPQPPWLGEESVAGRTVFLHFEAGYGDTLQFCRYVPLVAELGARVILGVPRPLRRLLEPLPGVALVVTPEDPIPEFDFHCPLLSLPLAFRTTLATIPACVPYLRAEARQVEAWRDRLGVRSKPRVGLVWSGGFRQQAPERWSANQRRNIPLTKLAPLAHPQIEFYSLQKGEPAESELTELSQQGWAGPRLIDLTASLTDFADTAALIMNLDLVISVDTSTAHLAGALGKPVWVMNRFDTCWRWLLERTDSPWYPTLRLYRQSAPGDWDGVVRSIRGDLEKQLTSSTLSNSDNWRTDRLPLPVP